MFRANATFAPTVESVSGRLSRGQPWGERTKKAPPTISRIEDSPTLTEGFKFDVALLLLSKAVNK